MVSAAPLAGPTPLIDVHAHFFFEGCRRAEWDALNQARFRAGERIGISIHVASILGSWGRFSPTYFASPADTTRGNDAMQAIARIGEDIPDCVLLDVMMPGMSGLELLERLRQDPLTATLPVMMLTAATDDDTTWTGWAHGASCYVPKPFDIDHMLDWVSKLCAPPAEEPMDPDLPER